MKVVIWGHKLHSHTHSYVHYGFYRAFKHLGFNTYWFDNNDNVAGVDFTDALFITERQVDQKIPLVSTAYYVVHDLTNIYDLSQYDSIRHRILTWGRLYHPLTDWVGLSYEKVEPYVYYNNEAHKLCFPYATDLLPDEIDCIYCPSTEPIINMIGSYGFQTAEYQPFIEECKNNGIQWHQTGLYLDGKGVVTDHNLQLIRQSIIAPAIQVQWQINYGHIPCRIFKNISYGKFGITNSPTVNELFEGNIVFNQDCRQLFYDAMDYYHNPNIKQIEDTMRLVRDRHTYINRIQVILRYLK